MRTGARGPATERLISWDRFAELFSSNEEMRAVLYNHSVVREPGSAAKIVKAMEASTPTKWRVWSPRPGNRSRALRGTTLFGSACALFSTTEI